MRPAGVNVTTSVVAMVTMLLLACCGRGTTYSGVGDVLAVDETARSLTIRHDDIPGLMSAMTMEFPTRSRQLLAGITAGEHIGFELVREGDRLAVTRVTELAPGDTSPPGLHNHTPQHGGVVTMAGMIHLEAVAVPESGVRVYVTDARRRPVPLDGMSGAITLDLPDGPQTFPVAIRDGALEVAAPRLRGSAVRAHVHVTWHGNDIEEHFLLPLDGIPS
jgi:Cu/Ag efflux protein CusF